MKDCWAFFSDEFKETRVFDRAKRVEDFDAMPGGFRENFLPVAPVSSKSIGVWM